MPQFDFYSFALQNFYVLLAFFGLYFFILICYLPQYAEAIKMRKKLIKYYGKQNSNQKLELVSLFYKHLFTKRN